MVSKSPFLFACALEISAPIEKATLSPDPRGFRIAHIPSPVQFFYQYVAQVLIGFTNKNPEPHIGINVEISEREKSKSQTHKKKEPKYSLPLPYIPLSTQPLSSPDCLYRPRDLYGWLVASPSDLQASFDRVQRRYHHINHRIHQFLTIVFVSQHFYNWLPAFLISQVV